MNILNKITFLPTVIACISMLSLSACTAEMKDAWASEKRAISAYDYAETIDKINPTYTKRRYIKYTKAKNAKKACVHNASEDRVVFVEGLSEEINYRHCMGRTFDGAPSSQRLEGR